MALIKWVSGLSGNWSDKNSWGGSLPGPGDDVQIEVPNVTVTLSSGTYQANSLTTAGSTFDLASTGTLTIKGNALFGGAYVQGGGVMTVDGSYISQKSFDVSNGTLTFLGSSTVLDNSAVQTGGTVQLFNGTLQSNGAYTENGGKLLLYFQGGTFNNLTLDAGTISSIAPNLQVNGFYSQIGGTLNAQGRGITLAAGFSQTAGDINIQTGELLLQGSGSLGGTVSGGGTLHVAAGTTTLMSTAVLSLPAVSVTGGELIVNNNMSLSRILSVSAGGTLALQGHTLTLLGRLLLAGELAGAGLYDVNGGGQINGLMLDGTAVLDIGNTVNVTGGFSMGQSTGSRATLNVLGKVGHLDITGNYIVSDASQNGQINNAGAITKTGGSGTATINANVNSTSIINVNIGKLAFDGPSNSFGGVINGGGTFSIGAGQNAFAKNLALNVAHVTLEAGGEQLMLKNAQAYAGEWSQLGGTLWLDGAGVVLTESGRANLDGGLITGNGTLSSTGTASHLNVSGVDIEGTATLNVTGNVNQTSSVSIGAQVGSAPTVNIAAGAMWRIEGNSNLGGQAGAPQSTNATFNNSGLIVKQNGSVSSYIAGDLDNTGTLEVNHSTLTLYGGGSLGGSLAGNGTVDLNGNFALAGNLVLAVGRLGINGGITTLGGNLADTATGQLSMDGGVLEVGSNTLTVQGLTSLEGGTLASVFGGTGGLVATGQLVLGGGYEVSYGTLVADGPTDQIGDITVGDYLAGAVPQGGTAPASAAKLEVGAGATYQLDDNGNILSNGTLAVLGTFQAEGAGNSNIGPNVVGSGTILGNSAHLTFLGPVGGSVALKVGDGGSLTFNESVGASNSISFTTGTGSLYLADPADFAAHIAGFVSGDYIELANLSTDLSADKLLLNGTGTVLTISDNGGNSYSLTFSTAQSLGSLSLAYGPHGSAALFHS